MNKHGGYKGDSKKVIDFSVNISPFGPPESVKQGIVESLEEMERYPSIDGEDCCDLLKKGFSLEHVHPQELIIGNGAMELIYLFARSLKPRKVLLVQPTFNEYQRAFELVGTRVEHFILEEREDFAIPKDQLIKKLQGLKPEVLILCSPNNPTGARYGNEMLTGIVREMKEWGGVLFLDESFEEFVLREEKTEEKESNPTLLQQSPMDNVFILRSLTKFYGIPGLRLGYGIGSKDLINKMLQNKEPWTVNTFAFKALEKIAMDRKYPLQLEKWLRDEKAYLKTQFEALENRGLKIHPGSANFHLGKIPGTSAKVLQDKLLEMGIYIRTCEDFRGLDHEHFRFALRTRKDNEKLIRALGKLLES